MAQEGSPFGTFLIVGPTCFFLGILFANFPYDYYVLWSIPPSAAPDGLSPRAPYFTLLENHLKFLYNSPPLINRILHTVIGTGLVGILAKLYKPNEANMLFDGATCVLYTISVVIYVSNIIKGLRMVDKGTYDKGVEQSESPGAGAIIGREDSLKVLAATNTILALVLVGILVLQAGQWYAQKKEAAELEQMQKAAEAEKKASRGKSTAGEKKKQ